MYDSAVRLLTLGGLDWEGDTVKVLLADDRYEPDQVNDSSRADLLLAEVLPSGTYQSGGAVLSSRQVAMEPNEVLLQGGSVRWYDFTGEFRYAVVYQANNDNDRADDLLIAYTDLGLQRATNATVTLDFDSDGVCAFSVATREGDPS